MIFKINSEDDLSILYHQAIINCISILQLFTERKEQKASNIINQVRGTFGLHGLSMSKSNGFSVDFLIYQTEKVSMVQYKN